ncbi:MAG: M56 family metallopeptidase [Eubacterium sp.]|nr:M56 family metallopeptidase [Eubacterium sp.]
MKNLFLSVLGVSASASILIVALLLFGPLMNRRYGAKWRYRIWVILALWLAFPFSAVQMAADALAQRPHSTQEAESGIQAPAEQNALPGRIVLRIPEQMTAPITVQKDSGKMPVTLFDVAAAAWMAGSVLFFLMHLASYVHYKKKLLKNSTDIQAAVQSQLEGLKTQMRIRRTVPVRRSIKAASPMVIGFLHPVLILPDEAYCEKDLYFILKHELVHFKRMDVWAKLLFTAANAVHWFHPLVYLMTKEAAVDMELSCDEKVVEGAGSEIRKAYTETLFSTLHKQCTKKSVLSTQFYGGIKIMKRRFQNILWKTKKKNGRLLFLGILLLAACIGSAVGCSVSDTKPESESKSTTEPGTVSGEEDGGQDVFAQMAGVWRMDTDQMEDTSAWGTGISYGTQMAISETGEFSYYIGISAGGTGQCKQEGGEITVKIKPYEEHSTEEEILVLEYSIQDGEEQILMDWHDTDVYWKRSPENTTPENTTPENTAADVPDDGADSGAAASDGISSGQDTGSQPMITVTKEGIPEQKPAYVAVGNGFSFYLPQGEWEQEDAEKWTSVRNEKVSIWFSSYHGQSISELEQLLLDGGYTKDGERYQMQEGEIITWAQPKAFSNTGKNLLWCVFYCCPSDAEEGFGSELAAIADTFAVTESAGSTLLGTDDQQKIKQVVTDFADCYFKGDAQGIRAYLADTFAGSVDTASGSGTVTDFTVKGFSTTDTPVNEDSVYAVSLEYKESSTADSFMYITFGFVKQGGEWKIQWYGQEA